MNSRQFHRNSMLAFPKTVAYADAIERPCNRAYGTVWWVCMGIIGAVTLALTWSAA